MYNLTTRKGPTNNSALSFETRERYQIDKTIALKCLTKPMIATVAVHQSYID